MNLKNITTMLTIVCLAAITVTIGCKKKEQPTTPKTPAMEMKDMQKQAATTAEEANKAAATAMASNEQTTCPIMDGNKINKNVFVEYKGKKVYFCCAACKEPFEKDPEKYIAKLPQFAK